MAVSQRTAKIMLSIPQVAVKLLNNLLISIEDGRFGIKVNNIKNDITMCGALHHEEGGFRLIKQLPILLGAWLRIP